MAGPGIALLLGALDEQDLRAVALALAQHERDGGGAIRPRSSRAWAGGRRGAWRISSMPGTAREDSSGAQSSSTRTMRSPAAPRWPRTKPLASGSSAMPVGAPQLEASPSSSSASAPSTSPSETRVPSALRARPARASARSGCRARSAGGARRPPRPWTPPPSTRPSAENDTESATRPPSMRRALGARRIEAHAGERRERLPEARHQRAPVGRPGERHRPRAPPAEQRQRLREQEPAVAAQDRRASHLEASLAAVRPDAGPRRSDRRAHGRRGRAST